jgi:hypothetical protein
MNDVMISRKAGSLLGYLNQDAMNRLIKALEVAKDYDAIAEPYKSWLTSKSLIKQKDMSKSAILATKLEA